MHLIIGGRYMGKKNYALKIYGSFENVTDLSTELPEKIKSGLIINIHDGVKILLEGNIDPLKFFADRIDTLRHSVIIGDEICGGVVPVEAFARKWRDETGRLYQFLADESEIVDRIFAGLPLRLKG